MLIALAAMSGAMLWIAPQLVERYQRIATASPAWAKAYLLGIAVVGGMLLVSAIWTIGKLWLRTRAKRGRKQRRATNPSELSSPQQEAEISENLAAVEQLKTEDDLSPEERRELDPLTHRIEEKRESQQLEIVAFGVISSGKSSLLNALAGRDVFSTDARGGTTLARNEILWPGDDKVTLVDTPGLEEVGGVERTAESAAAARDADIVLLVVDGPLRQSEFDLLAQLGEMEKRLIVCLNKVDWYDAREKERLLSQIAEQVKEFVHSEDVLAVRSNPTHHLRLSILPDGTESEVQVPVESDITPLADRLLAIVRQDGKNLLLANLLLQSRGLIDEAKGRVRQTLDRRAQGIVDKYMWAAGGAAAISPLPLIDLAAGSAITTKMVLDLAHVYRQEVDLDLATQWLSQLGKNLVAILGVAAVSPALATGIASLLKTVPGIGTIAGGTIQGIVQAIVTRWIGHVFINYFQNDMKPAEGGLAELARRHWDEVTSVAELTKIVQAARDKMKSNPTDKKDDEK